MFTGKHLCWSLFLTKLQAFLPHSDWTWVSLCIRISPYPIWMREKNWTSLIYVHSKSKLIENIYNLQEWHQNTKFFISYKTFTVGKITKTCQEQPNLVSGRLIQVFYKTTTFPRWPLLSGPKSGCLIQVWLYKCFEQTFLSFLNLHAPMKSKKHCANFKSYMTKFLSKTIMKQSELSSKYHKTKNIKDYNNHKKQRNFCSILYKKERRKFYNNLKLVSVIFYQICIFSPNDSPSKTMKNVFYFI